VEVREDLDAWAGGEEEGAGLLLEGLHF
jgi:hypothetical protein